MVWPDYSHIDPVFGICQAEGKILLKTRTYCNLIICNVCIVAL